MLSLAQPTVVVLVLGWALPTAAGWAVQMVSCSAAQLAQLLAALLVRRLVCQSAEMSDLSKATGLVPMTAAL